MADGPTYIPSREADFVTWLTNFNTLIVASPTSYGVDSSSATNLNSLTTTYLSAYTAGTAPSTRTKDTVAAKNTARLNVTAFTRVLASQIQLNIGVTDDQKAALGLTIRKVLPTPIPSPTSSPLLSFVAATPLQHTLRASDQNTPSKRGKPFGVQQLKLSVWILPQGTTLTGNPNQVNIFTKQPMAINFTNADVGKVAWYQGTWMTRTGLTGPVSTTLNATIV